MKIILKASAPGEFTNVDYALVELNAATIASLLIDIELVGELKKKNKNVYLLEKWDYTPEIFDYCDEVEELFLDASNDWVKLDSNLPGDLEPQRLDAVRLAVSEDDVHWRGYIKHDDREWSTAALTRADLIGLLEKVAA